MTSKEAFTHIINDDFNMVLTMIPPKLAYNNVSKEEMIRIIEKDLEVLGILKKHLRIDENYYSQDNGSTEAIKLCISNCVSAEEDEEYTDECYPNYDYGIIKE